MTTPRVSVCTPYWNRRGALESMLDDLQSKYGSDERWLEVSICDDGSTRITDGVVDTAPEIVTLRELDRWRGIGIVLSHLAPHDAPRCSALAINVAVESSTAPVVVIQNPETTHRDANVLLEIERQVLAAWPNSPLADPVYVVSSCWEADLQQWYEHPIHRPKMMHWCVGMHRELWQRAGGIDLGLMAGHCYEDNDLRNRIHKAGAKFVACEDLVVEHHKHFQEKYVGRAGIKDHWDPALTAKNRERYLAVWGRYWPDHGGDGE